MQPKRIDGRKLQDVRAKHRKRVKERAALHALHALTAQERAKRKGEIKSFRRRNKEARARAEARAGWKHSQPEGMP